MLLTDAHRSGVLRDFSPSQRGGTARDLHRDRAGRRNRTLYASAKAARDRHQLHRTAARDRFGVAAARAVEACRGIADHPADIRLARTARHGWSRDLLFHACRNNRLSRLLAAPRGTYEAVLANPCRSPFAEGAARRKQLGPPPADHPAPADRQLPSQSCPVQRPHGPRCGRAADILPDVLHSLADRFPFRSASPARRGQPIPPNPSLRRRASPGAQFRNPVQRLGLDLPDRLLAEARRMAQGRDRQDASEERDGVPALSDHGLPAPGDAPWDAGPARDWLGASRGPTEPRKMKAGQPAS